MTALALLKRSDPKNDIEASTLLTCNYRENWAHIQGKTEERRTLISFLNPIMLYIYRYLEAGSSALTQIKAKRTHASSSQGVVGVGAHNTKKYKDSS